jgi:hypothetical protein
LTTRLREEGTPPTTPSTANTSVLWPNEKLPRDQSGNVFSIDSNHGAAQQRQIKVKWVSEGELLAAYRTKARILFQAIRERSTDIRYQASEK